MFALKAAKPQAKSVGPGDRAPAGGRATAQPARRDGAAAPGRDVHKRDTGHLGAAADLHGRAWTIGSVALFPEGLRPPPAGPAPRRASPAQAVPKVGAAADSVEREAERVAAQITGTAAPADVLAWAPPEIRRTCRRCEDEGAGTAAAEGVAARAGEAPDSVHAVLHAPGQPLDAASRAYFEPRFGRDFGQVRVHADAAAARSARAVNALAYAAGRHIVFDAGAYAPTSEPGRRLLAHELAHVVQQSGGGTTPGAPQEHDAQAAAAAVQAGLRPHVRAASAVGFAAQLRHGFADDQSGAADWEDRDLGITVVTIPAIEAKIRTVIDHPGWQVRDGKADFNADPARAKANVYHTHFRNDAERLSYALGAFEGYLGAAGDGVDPGQLFQMMLTYEVQMQRQIVDLVMHAPPTPQEKQKLEQLRRRRRAEAAARAAEQARQEAERARRLPEDISKYNCPDPKVSGPYLDQGIALHYDKLVPDPDPRVGFDKNEVLSVLHDPRKFEQLYFDATHGFGKAVWLVCAFESHVGDDARNAAHDVADVTTLHGLVHTLLGTGGYDFGRYGFSPTMPSGRRMFTVFSKAFADEARDVQLSNTVLTNLLNLWAAGKLAEGALANVDTRLPAAPTEPLPPPRAALPGGAAGRAPAVGDVIATPLGPQRIVAIAPNGDMVLQPVIRPPAPGGALPPAAPEPAATQPKTQPALPDTTAAPPPDEHLSLPSKATDPQRPALGPARQSPAQPAVRGQRRRVKTAPPAPEASQAAPVARPSAAQVVALRQRIEAIAHKDVIVGVQVTVTVGGEPVSVGLKSDTFRPFHESRQVGGTERAAILPPVPNPAKTPARLGTHQPSAGLVVEPNEASRSLEIIAYNTSAPVRGSNASHAERQVISYLDGQPEAWLARVDSVEGVVIGRDICEGCDTYIDDLRKTIANLRKKLGLPPARFSWVRGD